MTVGIVVQARQGSSRFPNKVMQDLCGAPMLVREIERLQQMSGVDRVIVATTDRSSDDIVADCVAGLSGVGLFRGDEYDVLGRFAGAAAAYSLDVVGRVTGDCPFIEPAVVERVLSTFLETPDCGYASNCRPRSFPHGYDCEFVSRSALDAAAREATDPFDREHVLVYVFTRPERFVCVNVEEPGAPHKSLRLTVDYPEDLDFARSVFDALLPHNPQFAFADILALLKDKPELLAINKDVPAHESVTESSHRDSHPRAIAKRSPTG